MAYKRARLKSALPQQATWLDSPNQKESSDHKNLDRTKPTLVDPTDDETTNAQITRDETTRDTNTYSTINHEAAVGLGNSTPEVRQRTRQRTTTSKRRLERRIAPLELLQQPLQASVRKVFDLRRFLIVIALTVGVLFLPQPEGLSEAGHRALALFVFTGSILALEPAPLPISALLVPICQIALGIDQSAGAFGPFGSPVEFLILGSLFLAEALRKHGLTRRLALYVIILSKGNFKTLLFGLMLITSGLSMWVLNTATAAVLIPVAITIAQRVQNPDHAQRALTMLILAIAYSSSIGAIPTIMGSGENAIASSLLAQVQPFGFIDWMKYGLPVLILLLPLTWFLLQQAIRLPKVTLDTTPVEQELERLGGLKSSERKILFVLGISVILWITGANIEQLLNLPKTLLSSVVVAIGAVAVLSIEEVIDWNDLKGVNWGVFFVIGAGLTLGDALAKTGANLWFAGLLGPLLDGLPYVAILSILVLMAFTITQFLNNVPLGAIFAPILLTLAEANGTAPPRLLLPTIFTLALAYTLPGGSARITLAAVTGAVQSKDMMRTGLIVGIPSAICILIYFYIIGKLGFI
ncbi:MAG: DASS family sodium-coupled anion symporter [Chloroflexota bacterium]